MSSKKVYKVGSHIKDPAVDKIFYRLNTVFLCVFLLLVTIPVLYVVSASFSSASAVVSGKVLLWPVEPTLAGYEGVLRDARVVSGFINSAFYLVVSVALSLIFTICAAYPLSMPELPGNRVLSFLFAFVMMFGGGLIPTYLLIDSLGMMNTIWTVTLFGSFGVTNMIIMRTYFRTDLPRELYEAASIDGCGPIRYLISCVIPLSGAIIAIIALYSAVGSWNSWYNAMVYIDNKDLFPLQLVLRDILINMEMNFEMMTPEQMEEAQETADLLRYSLIVISTTPMMIIYPFIQKYFVRGVMSGAIKG